MYSGVGECLFERFYELLRQTFAVLFRGLQLVGDRAVLLRLGETEVDVLHLALDVVESELVRKRDVQHQGLQNLLLSGGLREHLQMPHHLQPVGYLEHGHARVRRVLHDEFLVALGLQPCVLGLDCGDLVQPLHHCVDILRKSAFQFNVKFLCLVPELVEGPFRPQINLGMLSGGFMKKHRSHAVSRQTDLVRRDQRHVERMLDERMAVATRFSIQGGRCYRISFVDEGLSRLIVLGKSLMNRVHSKVRFTTHRITPPKIVIFLEYHPLRKENNSAVAQINVLSYVTPHFGQSASKSHSTGRMVGSTGQSQVKLSWKRMLLCCLSLRRNRPSRGT